MWNSLPSHRKPQLSALLSIPSHRYWKICGILAIADLTDISEPVRLVDLVIIVHFIYPGEDHILRSDMHILIGYVEVALRTEFLSIAVLDYKGTVFRWPYPEFSLDNHHPIR